LVRQMSNRYASQTRLRLLAICGVIGPVIYAIVVLTLGLLRPGYNPVTQSMSEFGEVGAPNAIVMNAAGFILLGLLMIAFTFGLHRGISKGKGSKIGPALLAVTGVGLVGAGIFPCDPGCVDESLIGIVHSIFSTISAFAGIFAPFAISRRLKKDSLWQGYWAYSVVTGVMALGVSAVYGLEILELWKGALQRVSMGIHLLWIEVMAIRLLRLSISR